jgi:excinuclease ABC subunit C
LFKDSAGRIIYIGKAVSLKKRVQSYFSRFLSAKTQAMVAKIADLEYILSPNESQAQILEAALIKEKQPQYNISLKDDKSFPLIRISDEDFPVVSICRRKKPDKDDNALYFGPYTDAALLRQALKLTRRLFGFRSCRALPKKPCLYFRLKLCPAPCAGKISVAKYRKLIQQITLFLSSRYVELAESLSLRMQQAAAEKRYEEAAAIRDQLDALSAIAAGKGYSGAEKELYGLKELLGAKKIALRIEGFDISNISGKEATGAMVSFYKGMPDKNNYRRFRIKGVDKIDDYAMLREVIRRRYQRLKEENKSLPELVLIDGGKQHLMAAQDELGKLGLDPDLIAIAKEEENIYLKGKDKPVKTGDSPGLNLIRRVRDEAHRFARKYHHLLHKKKTLGG